MIKKLLTEEEFVKLKKYFIIAGCYIIFDIICLVIVNTVLTRVLPEYPFKHLILYTIALVLALLFYSRAGKRAVRLIETVVSNKREGIIEKVRNAELESFEILGKSRIYNAITLDTQTISDVINMIMQASENGLLTLGVLIYLLTVSRAGFLLTVGVIGCGNLIYAYQVVRIKKWINQAREKEKELFDAISDAVYGFKELRVNDIKSDDFFHHTLKEKSAENRKYRIKAEYAFAGSNVLSTFIEFSIFIPIVFILPSLNLSIHGLIIAVIMILFIPFSTIKESLPYLVRAGVSIDRLLLLEKELEKIKVEKSFLPPKVKTYQFREISYNNICFAYANKGGNSAFSLEDISLSVYPGETLFIIGGNGSGKSTLLKVITGLYLPFSGNIKIDGSEVKMAQHRYLFSAIFSDFHLFNQLYGLKDIDKQRVNELLRIMELDEKLSFEDNKFSTLDLSTGQRKRLAMIVAMMEDKPVYVFDEWAADQTSHFREYFYLEMLPSFEASGKTVIAVTHDDRYFKVADRILKLDYGRLSDSE